MQEVLKRTPLHAFHVDHEARLVPFAGWEMPVQYTSILEEHRAVREAAGLFDVSHMGEARIHGSGAREFLNHLLTNDVGRLEVGRAIYSVMCAEDGGVVDDLIVYQVGDEEYFLCLNAANVEKDVAWMERQAERFDCLVDNVSDNFGQLALQGPRALEIFRLVSGTDLSELKRFRFVQGSFMQTHALISRTGYTGEDGLEIYLPAGETARIANRMVEIGKDLGLRLVGLGARDSLRLEAGYPLYGHEISERIDPLTGGLDWVVKFRKKNHFIGREALLRVRESGPKSKVVFFRLEDRRIARQGTPVVDEAGKVCGRVLSGSQSPLTGRPIGSALVPAGDTTGPEQVFHVEIRKTRSRLHVARPPLHKVLPSD